ncbi:hypothetical protein L1049_019544 [Liquidambar formosana]|uniref:Uncharacterized protein n=1 Tax=Liquidambar formosana TaxID=63359 RepID=A0AAP0XA88_LIQFO
MLARDGSGEALPPADGNLLPPDGSGGGGEAITRSLLGKEKADKNGCDHGGAPRIRGGDEAAAAGCATPVLVFSTLVALCGSYVFGSALGYSSPAESGIMADMGLSLAETFQPSKQNKRLDPNEVQAGGGLPVYYNVN